MDFQVTDSFGKKRKGQYALATVLSFFPMDNVKAGSANIDGIRKCPAGFSFFYSRLCGSVSVSM